MSKNGLRYGVKSPNIRNQRRRSKKRGLTVDQLIKNEQEEQDKLDHGYKFCFHCKQWKVFGKNAAYCKKCCSDNTMSRYDLEKQRSYKLVKKYGITLDDYKKLLVSQNNKCYICQISEESLDRALAVDHCHDTGKVRGLLCGNCNRFLGQIKDDIVTAKRLLEYLNKYKDV